MNENPVITLNTAGNDGGGVHNDHGILTVNAAAVVIDNTPNDIVEPLSARTVMTVITTRVARGVSNRPTAKPVATH